MLQGAIKSGLHDPQRAQFETLLIGRTLEGVLSRLRRIAALLDPKGTDTVDGMDGASARTLDTEICRLIINALDIGKADIHPMLRLAAWAARADYHLPVEVFTINYDLLVETALEALGVPYFDGFVGSLKARFRTELVEASMSDPAAGLPAFLVRLWKLHGSVNWSWDATDDGAVVRLGAPVPTFDPAAIYPSDAKYDESRRVPFVVLQDRFRRALAHPETLVLISGYSFGDAHLNEMLFDAARRRPRSELIVFSYGSIADDLAERASSTPNLQVACPDEAVIGGIRAAWAAPADPIQDVWEAGKFKLGDFARLAAFLARSSPPDSELEARLGELLAKAAGGTSAGP